MITSGWPMVIYPFLMPGTPSIIDLEIDPTIVSSTNKTKIFVSPNGYFMKKQKQKIKFKSKFYKKCLNS